MRDAIVRMIDHAVLQPTQTDDDVRAACALGAELGVASVCVKSSHVALAAESLDRALAQRAEQPAVLVTTVVGFPHGGTSTDCKVAETRAACRDGAREVDMVVNLGKALSADWEYVERDIRAVVEAAREAGAITKVIFETGLLPSDEIKVRLCQASEAAGAAFVKTSTGFGYRKQADGTFIPTGATEHDVRLLRKHCGSAVQVKASGGIRTYEQALRFVELGATRLGTSSTEAIASSERGAATGSPRDY